MNKINKILIGLIVILLLIGTTTAIPILKSSKVIEVNNENYFSKFQPTKDNGFVFIGTIGTSDGRNYPVIMKTDDNGSIIWNRKIDRKNDTIFEGIELTNDGGYILSGASSPRDLYMYDGYLLKVNNHGKKQWDSYIGGNLTDVLTKAIQTTDGGYAVIGVSSSYTRDYQSIWLVKTDSDGIVLWNKSFESNFDSVNDFLVTSDGGYIIVGSTGRDNGIIFKTDYLGDVEWRKIFNKNKGTITSVKEITDGYVITGFSEPLSITHTVDNSSWFMKLNDTGNKVWYKNISIGNFNKITKIVPTKKGYLLLGSVDNDNGLLIKTNLKGREKWNYTLGGDMYDEFLDIVETTNNNFTIFGYTESYRVNNSSTWFVTINNR